MPWFNYEVQKLCSITASMATLYFNTAFNIEMKKFLESHSSLDSYGLLKFDSETHRDIYYAYLKSIKKGGIFDSRCFNVPVDDICNYFIWRQQDATRNSIQMVGQSYFNHKQLQGLSCNDIQDMLMLLKEINWNIPE